MPTGVTFLAGPTKPDSCVCQFVSLGLGGRGQTRQKTVPGTLGWEFAEGLTILPTTITNQ